MSGLDPALVWAVRVLQYVTAQAGVPIRISSGLRSRAKQEQLYADYLAGRTRFPVAKPGTSLHELGRAVDVVWVATGVNEPFEGAWEALGGFAEQFLGLRWGGRFSRPDPVHFELSRFGRAGGDTP